jgi:hypothetical protein
MPISLNLLAEAKAEEDLRRRDPVKRAIWAALALIVMVLLWSGLLWFRTMGEQKVLDGMEETLASQSGNYKQLLANEKEMAAINQKLGDLERISTNRFLWGSVLNALQQSVVNDVQLLGFHGEQSYQVTGDAKTVLNDQGRVVSRASSGYTTQRISLDWNASDSSATPGDQVQKYKDALSKSALFSRLLDKNSEITLKNLSPPSIDSESGKTIVMFSLECRLPDKLMK